MFDACPNVAGRTVDRRGMSDVHGSRREDTLNVMFGDEKSSAGSSSKALIDFRQISEWCRFHVRV